MSTIQTDPLLARLLAAQQPKAPPKAKPEAPRLDAMILRMWRGRWDTAEIARVLGVHQSVVANRLAIIRDAGR